MDLVFFMPNLDRLARPAEATDFSFFFVLRNQMKKNQLRALRADVQLALY